MPSSDSLTHAVSDPSSLMLSSGVVITSSSAQSTGSGSLNINEAGVFASASLVAFRGRKEVELNEVCSSMIGKIPKLWNRVSNELSGFRNEGNSLRVYVS